MFRFKSEAQKEKLKSESKLLAKRMSIILVFSFFMAFFIRLVSLDDYNKISSLFDSRSILQTIALGGIWAIMLFTMQLYIVHGRNNYFTRPKLLPVMLVSILLTFAFSAITGNYLSVFSMPLALGGLFIATLIDDKIGFVVNILMNQAFFVSYILLFGNSMLIDSATAMIAGTVSGTLMIFSLKKSYSRALFSFRGMGIGLITAALAMLATLISKSAQWDEILKNGFWAFISSFVTIAVYSLFLPFMEKGFRMYSTFLLDEICSFEQPLLKRLYDEAPGTFSHSMVVSNLAQACAYAIGENHQLARAAACYHDVGKLSSPLSFVENQSDYNPHDDYIPEVSVKLITNHTLDGYALCKEAKLPTEICDITLQHHGTTPVDYFYNKVKNITEDDLQRDDFCYSGPKPKTKIAAIVMICDTAEAATRAVGIHSDSKEFRKFIHGLVYAKQDVGQYDDCAITFMELTTIEDTLIRILPTMYHSRISYNNKK